MTNRIICSESLFYYKKTSFAQEWLKWKWHKTHICLIALNKIPLSGNDSHLPVMLRIVFFYHNSHLATGLHFSVYIVQHAYDMLAQVSLLRFWSSCIFGGGAAYTVCFIYLHRKMSSGFRLGKRRQHSAQPPYPMICCWNVSLRFSWTL